MKTTALSKAPNGDLILDFELQGNDVSAEVVLHYGKQDGLTLIFEDDDQASKWEGTVAKRFPAGTHRWRVTAPKGSPFPDQGFCRLLANTNTGRFWSFQSSSW